MAAALSGIARPVLDTPAQVARWRSAGGGPCDVMIDTGINRLGLGMDDLDLLDGMAIDTLMSHLACADEDVVMNEIQRDRLVTAAATVPARRVSLANSAGIALGRSYAFDLTRPGLALYGGLPRGELADAIRQVVFPQAQVLQRRRVPAGQGVGYNATWVAQADAEIAIINLGYADGYARAFSGKGQAWYGDLALPIVGRVSMDLSAVLLPSGDGPSEGEWVTIDYDLVRQADLTARSPYELLTSLAHRFDRSWT
jgi:alanine racemase